MKIAKTKILDRAALLQRLAEERRRGRRIAFTNGCFDMLHIGHIRLLREARGYGDLLVVAINSDASVKRLQKGADRPIHGQDERAEVLAAFAAVDYVVIFDEDTPIPLLKEIRPDVLVKGGDWSANQVVGREVVEAAGGRVVQSPLVAGRSTTNIVARIREEQPR